MTRNFHWFGACQIEAGVTLKQAIAQMDTIGAPNRARTTRIRTRDGRVGGAFADTVVGNQLRQSLYVLLSAVGMVLLMRLREPGQPDAGARYGAGA
jgi:hypothetical protein